MNINILLPIKFDQAFTYLCDISLNLEQGDYVLVPFRNKEIVGIVWEKNVPNPKKIKLKKIIKKINFPKLTKNNITFINKFSQYNISSLGMTLKLFLYEKGLATILKKKLVVIIMNIKFKILKKII
ncbi:putative primosomal protein N [Candidatus Pelagibacter sp. IMCC9063]|uniref:primosomal protein N' family DNA-binding protein n=1 Tax=Pelagibacter sp. (strain IMCC9063) TaxID=1002672 RepID=UPI000204682D|nr:hypothetical protein [Candidatus Pelagibacter sp. IMCC9063]AEA80959.1 putative primosomal protein N [Candidatus Pelagibacter sp. IMCC9063]